MPVFKTQPWEHQLNAYNFAVDKQAVGIFMAMGTGKSKVVIDLIANRRHQKVLIACPKRVIDVWPKQFDIHSDGINVVPLKKGTVKSRAEIIANYNGPYPVVFVVNYDVVWMEPMKSILLKGKFDCVALDESHRIKKPGGKASRFFHTLGRITPWKMLLSGTPLSNSPLDAYGQYRFLDETTFGTNFDKFKDRYCIENKYSHKKEYINQEELSDKMYQIAFRVSADVLDLPEAMNQTYTVELPPSVMKIYKILEEESVLSTVTGDIAVNNPLAQMTKLHQLTSGVMVNKEKIKEIIDDSKAKILEDVFEDIDTREPLVVFGRFMDDLDRIEEVCIKTGRKYSEVSGRRDNLKEWQEGKTDVVGVQIQSGSEGEDYTRSHYAVYYSLGFSLKDYLQSRARIDRPGQKRHPMFIHILAEDTIDEYIMEALSQKKQVVDYVVDEWRRKNV